MGEERSKILFVRWRGQAGGREDAEQGGQHRLVERELALDEDISVVFERRLRGARLDGLEHRLRQRPAAAAPDQPLLGLRVALLRVELLHLFQYVEQVRRQEFLGDVVLELVRARLRLAPQPGPARRDEVLDLRPLLVVDVVVRGRGGVGRRRRVGLLRRARELEPRRARRRRRGRGLGDALGLRGDGALREERRGAVRAAPRVLLRPRGDAAVPVPYPVLLVGLDERLAPEPV